MQLIAIPRFRFNSTVFNPSLSAVLSGMTAVGAISAAIYNIDSARTSIGSSLQSLLSIPGLKHLLDGFNGLGKKFHDWGSAIVGSKDALANWIKQYLNIHGLKAGVAQLYQKLKDWGTIVYEWFRDKFWIFIKNIPQMVRDWDKLRLSLFKWGTFLGGGGGAALFAMFASGENWGKLQELMGRPDFEEIMGNLGKLMQNNSDAFEKMGPEEMQEILQEFLDNTEDAKEATEKLLKKQEEMNKNEQKEAEEEKEQKELSKEEILEEFSSSKGGNPPDKKAAFGKTVAGGLGKLVELFKKGGLVDQSPFYAAFEGMQKYIEKIEQGAKADDEKGRSKKTARQQFRDAIKDNKFAFMHGLASVAEKAYEKVKNKGTQPPKDVTQEEIAKAFMEEFEKRFTKQADEGEGNVNIDHTLFMKKS